MKKQKRVFERFTSMILLLSALLLFQVGRAIAAYDDATKTAFQNCCAAIEGSTYSETPGGGLHCELPGGGGFSAYDSDGDGKADDGEGWCVNPDHTTNPTCSNIDRNTKICLAAFL